MQSLDDLLKVLTPGTRVVVRLDLNAPVSDGKVLDRTRLEAVVPTVNALRETGACPILCSHLGRPKAQEAEFSLRPIASELGALVGAPLRFLAGMPADSAQLDAVQALQPGEVALLENLRFDPREKANEADFAGALAALGSVYVNDAFGTLHRAHASVVGVPALLPAYAGRLVSRELEVLSTLRDDPARPFWVILGGAKVADKLGVVRKLRTIVDGFVVGGGMANTFLAGLGQPVGGSRVETEWLDELRDLVEGEDTQTEWLFPKDFVAGDSLRGPAQTKIVQTGEDPGEGFSFFDVGPATADAIVEKLSGAQTVFWNGPLGVFEAQEYCEGTRRVAEALADHSGQCVVGGGDTAAAARKFHVADRVSHVSTGGGASLEYLEGKTLPGVKALDDGGPYRPAD